MKALIVDDERHVREAVKLLVEWEDHGIQELYEASDGEAAVEIIRRHRPELIFTDMMMPGMDGTKLLTWIQENAPRCKTIVISGFDDFRLVRHSMTAGGLDYILKPIDADQLEAAVKHAVQMWEQEAVARDQHLSRNIEVNLLKPIYWEKLFTDLIQNPDPDPKKEAEIRREYPEIASGPCRCSVINLAAPDPGLQAKYEKHRDLLFFTLTNVSNEILRRTRSGFAFRYWASEEEIVLLHWGECDRAEENAESINDGLHATLGARFDIGIGGARSFPNEVQQAYREAKTALQQRNVAPSDDRIYVLGATTESRNGKERSTMSEIQKYIEAHYNTDLSLMQIAAKFYLSREYISRKFKQDFGVNVSDYLERIRMDKAKLYLKNPSVKISQIAEMVGYQDMKYFSKVFKKTTGITPQEYRIAPKD